MLSAVRLSELSKGELNTDEKVFNKSGEGEKILYFTWTYFRFHAG
jgi:hypothetical protein